MKYVRATIDPATHEIKLIEAYERPMTSMPPRLTWCTAITVEVGAFEDNVFPEGVSVAQFLLDRLEFHPASGTLRAKAGVSDLPAAYPTPTTMQALKTRLNASGKRHGLPPAVCAHLREVWAAREDSKATHLAALGMAPAEIRALPRFQAVDHARTRARADAMAAEHAANADAKRQDRINRKLERQK